MQVTIERYVTGIPPVILWSPQEQIPFLSFFCCKCPTDIKQKIEPVDWTCGHRTLRHPRMLYCVNSNVLLISRVYQCSTGHEILGHHPDMLGFITNHDLHSVVPFVLWYQCGFTRIFCRYIHQLLTSGIALQKCESILVQNRICDYHTCRHKANQLKKLLPTVTLVNKIEECVHQLQTKAPSRNAIKGCFLYYFEDFEQLYDQKMRETSADSMNLWLSCDHTFRTVGNVGIFRQDGIWCKQYEGIFFVMNSGGEVVTWKATKKLTFDCVKPLLTKLKARLENHGKSIEEFIIDNCCSWRKKLQNVFGIEMKVSLDVFHAVQRIASKISKRHSFHSECLSDLKLVFRDPTDRGPSRCLTTPLPNVLLDNLKEFKDKWCGVMYCGQKIITPQTDVELKAIEKHMKAGCLSGIKVGRGTNRNERLHRQLNSILKSNRYGPEIASALTTCTLYEHNEKIAAASQKRQPNPINAYCTAGSNSEGREEKFGFSSESQQELSLESNRITSDVSCSCTLNDLMFSEALEMICNVASDEPENEDRDEDFAILKEAVSLFYICNKLQQQSSVQGKLEGGKLLVFNSFLAMASSSEPNTNDVSLDNALHSWNFERMSVAGDGNCLFTSVANLLIQSYESGVTELIEIFSELNISSEHYDDVDRIAAALREATVEEWLGDNCEYYQGFTTDDILVHAQQYRLSGEFAGNLGDLMVMTITNIIRLPLFLFTNIPNMLTILVSPSLSTPISNVPLYLVFNAAGAGHYDYAVPVKPQQTSVVHVEDTDKEKKCSCGRKSSYQGISCSRDKHDNCRCPCARQKVPCSDRCRCKCCKNEFGERPLPCTTRRRKLYDTSRHELRGKPGIEYLASVNEDVTVGKLSTLETIIIQCLLIYTIQNGLELTPTLIHTMYTGVLTASQLCQSIDFPIYDRSIRFITNYLKAIHVAIQLFQNLVTRD